MLARIAAMPDNDIDYSDIPPSPLDAKWVGSTPASRSLWMISSEPKHFLGTA